MISLLCRRPCFKSLSLDLKSVKASNSLPLADKSFKIALLSLIFLRTSAFSFVVITLAKIGPKIGFSPALSIILSIVKVSPRASHTGAATSHEALIHNISLVQRVPNLF